MESEGSTLLFDMNMNENPIDQAHPSIDRLTMRRIVIDLRDHTKDAFEETKTKQYDSAKELSTETKESLHPLICYLVRTCIF